MNTLILIAVGPVQDFIKQARRTRDLWYGSHLLSELSRATARSLAERATLIFPALPRGDVELLPCEEMVRSKTGRPPRSIANKILVRLEGTEDDAERIVELARTAMMTRWQAIAERVKQQCSSIIADNIEAAWREQIDTLPEFYAAWKSFDTGAYKTTREALETALAGRKNLREFSAWPSQRARAGVPKSSLDGARITVLKDPKALSPAGRRLRSRYRFGEGEQLDAVGLVKRAGGKPEQFIPIGNIALSRWVHRVRATAEVEVKAIEGWCEEQELSRVQRDVPWRPFTFDAQVFLPDRATPIAREVHPDDRDAARSLAEALRAKSAALIARFGTANPYVACLVADGDGMGTAISTLVQPEQHMEFSAQLAKFADAAREIVEQDSNLHGMLVYAGGDDVLAFVNLADAVRCAEALRRRFVELMAPHPVTLSVGIGVGHMLESMGWLLALGRDAERLAKGDHLPKQLRRNALGVIVEKRSGGRAAFRRAWTDDAVGRITRACERLRAKQLSIGKVYEVRRMLSRMPVPQEPTSQQRAVAEAALVPVLRHEVRRILGRNETVGASAGLTPTDVGLSLDNVTTWVDARREVVTWIDCMLIARDLVRAEVSS